MTRGTKMGKIPTVERDSIESMGITLQSAAKWYLFLAEEYEMLDDEARAKSYRQRSEGLSASPLKGYVVDANLEKEITKWTKKTNQV